MADDWHSDRAEPVPVGPPRQRMTRRQRAREARHRRRRRLAAVVALSMLVVVVVGAVFLGSRLWHSLFGGAGDDFAGGGVNDVVIQVHEGDSTTAIGQTLQDTRVVATVKAFVDAADGNSAISAIQPGFYKVRTEIPAANAVQRLADPANRVGKLVIPEGRQLDDVSDVKTNAVTDGIFTLISKATCVDLNGNRHCVSVDDLRRTATTVVPTALGVPQWAIAPVTALGPDHRRLEGLIAPGTWNIDPSATPQDILATLVVDQRHAVRAGRPARHRQYARHVAVSDPHGGLAGTARVHSGGFREGGAGDLQPARRTPHTGIRLHGQLCAGPHRGRDHRRRPGPGHAMEHLCAARPACHADLFAGRSPRSPRPSSPHPVTGCTS